MATRKLKWTGIGVAAAAVLMAGSASATTFLYSYTSDGETASGSLNATQIAPGEYEAVSGAITASGSLMTGAGTLTANPNPGNTSYSASGYFAFDDLVLPTQNPQITNGGLLFDIAGAEVNLFSNGPGPANTQLYVNTGANNYGRLTLSAAPEPAAWTLMLLGIGGLGAALRSARRTIRAIADY